jgi:ubiquinone/menaquinone biosynthesis C-methylase UbiE
LSRAESHYGIFVDAFLRGRAIQRESGAGASTAPTSELPQHYFKRVVLLARIQWALGVLHSIQPADLLDIGSGRGKFLWPLLDAFPTLPVTATDFNSRRVYDLAAVHLGGVERLSVRQADATHLPFADRSFDVVTMLEVLEHIPAAASALSEAVRVARRYVLLSVPSKPDENPEHIHLFAEDDLRAQLAELGVTQVKVQQAPGHWLALANVMHVA